MNATSSSIEQIFEDKYTKKQWPGGLKDGTRSGDGSTIRNTEMIRKFIPELFTTLGVQSLLDAPCGDFHWMKKIEFPENFRYIGGEVVQLIIDDLNKLETAPGYEFRQFNIIESKFPDVDAWLCRDCLIHLSLDNVMKSLRNFCNSNVKYALITHQENFDENPEIDVGRFARRNFLREPFNFPEPIHVTADGPFDGHDPLRKLGVWTREQIAQAIG